MIFRRYLILSTCRFVNRLNLISLGANELLWTREGSFRSRVLASILNNEGGSNLDKTNEIVFKCLKVSQLTKCQVDEMEGWQVGKIVKLKIWQAEKMAS